MKCQISLAQSDVPDWGGLAIGISKVLQVSLMHGKDGAPHPQVSYTEEQKAARYQQLSIFIMHRIRWVWEEWGGGGLKTHIPSSVSNGSD